MTSIDKFIFLYQINGPEELAKKLGSSEINCKRVFKGEIELQPWLAKETDELYEMREKAMRFAARFTQILELERREQM